MLVCVFTKAASVSNPYDFSYSNNHYTVGHPSGLVVNEDGVWIGGESGVIAYTRNGQKIISRFDDEKFKGESTKRLL